MTERLRTLVRRELVRHSGIDSAGDETWEFRHALIRDEAYRSIPKRRCAELHEAVARHAVETGAGDVDVTVGYHLEQAVRSRRDIGRGGLLSTISPARRRGISARGPGRVRAERLRRVRLPSSPLSGDAAGDLARATRTDAKLVLALVAFGDRAGSESVASEARAIAEHLGDEVASARIALAEYDTGSGSAPDQILEDLDRIVPILERVGDDEGVAWAELLRFHIFDRTGKPALA